MSAVETITEREMISLTDARLDRANGIIRGVKILGSVSRNGRRYTSGAMRKAIALYEGSQVNVNHPKGSPATPRDYQDRLGRLRNVVERNGALFADLYYNPKHAIGPQLEWDVEHAPQNVGMSHNVDARTSRQNGDVVVEEILRVHSVDLVADPATTTGLFESADPNRDYKDVSSLMEALRDETSAASHATFVRELCDDLDERTDVVEASDASGMIHELLNE
jgi:hypothetical protein